MHTRNGKILLLAAILCCSAAAPATGEPERLVFRDVPVPQSLSLCGEAMPLQDRNVFEMLDRELTISAWQPEQVFMWLKRAGRAFPVIAAKLAQRNMPDDLKYLAVAESSLLYYIESNKAAVGTWQMIQETGTRHGLRKDELTDGRLSLESSTDAALQYLQNLHAEFGSWALALAAYNCGEARVRREIDLQKVTDYYRLNLPIETERFVFRVAAIKLIMQSPEKYGFVLPPERIYRPVRADSVGLELLRSLAIADVALAIGADFKTLKELNPEFTKYDFPPGSYAIKVPEGLGGKTTAAVKALQEAQARQQAKEALENNKSRAK